MFDKASLKLGLDKAVLQDINRKGSNNGVRVSYTGKRSSNLYSPSSLDFHVNLYLEVVMSSYLFSHSGINQSVCFWKVQQLSKMEVEDLLRKGAYGALMDEEDEGSKFCEEDIDQILQRRTQTITIQTEGKGSTFSKVGCVLWGQNNLNLLWKIVLVLVFISYMQKRT